MDLARLATTRHTAKAFDSARKIPESVFVQLRTLLRFSPSSVNSQPWHFIIAASEAGKARLARAATGPYAYNAPKIQKASHVVVFCARCDMADEHLAAILGQEQQDGRFPLPEDLEKQRLGRAAYVELHRHRQDLPQWMEKQVYLALGTLLLGAAVLGLDACPMEGFDPEMLAAELGLAKQGLRPLALVALGYHGRDDWNRRLPKSRLAADAVFTEL